MHFTINERSFSKYNTRAEAVTGMMVLAGVGKMLFQAGFRSAKIWDKRELLGLEIFDNLKVADWIKNSPNALGQEKLSIQFLGRLIDKTSSLNFDEDERQRIDAFPIICIKFTNEEIISCPGVKIACLDRTLALSLSTDQKWNRAYLELIHVDDDEERPTVINHASDEVHIKEHANWIRHMVQSGRLLADWDPSVEPFPNLEFSNECVKDGDWDNFHEEKNKCKTIEEIRAVILKYSKEVAKRNHYVYNQRVSAMNTSEEKKRVIFSAGYGRQTRYLSVDLEKGGFELCDHDGYHLGQFFLDGIRTSGAKSDHNIKVKS